MPVWKKYQFKKAEKKRKALEKAALSKGKKKKKTARPAASAVAEPVNTNNTMSHANTLKTSPTK